MFSILFQSTPSLENISVDNLTDEELDISDDNLPGHIIVHLKSMNRTKENIFRNSISSCTLCDEIHLFNFNRDIYEKQVRVSLSKFIRDEHKFESVEALKQQIITDQQQIQFHFDTY